MFHHFEEYLDVPSFPVDPDDLIVGQLDIRGCDRQPVPFVAVSNKDDFHLLLMLGLNDNAGKDFCLAGAFLQAAVQGAEGYQLPLITIKYLWHILRHAKHWQMSAKFGKDRGPAKPTVHEDVVGLDTEGQGSFDHFLKMSGGLGHGLQSPFETNRPFIKFLFDALNPCVLFGRRAEDEIQGQETCSIGPAEGQQFEPFERLAAVMVKHPGQQFDDLGAGPIIDAVVKDQNLFSLFRDKQAEKANHLHRQDQQEFSPVVTWILQQLISGIFLERQLFVLNDPSKEILTFEGQHENGGKQCERGCSPLFPYPALVQCGADPEVVDERENSIMQTSCLLLLLMLFGNIHASPFSLMYCCFSQNQYTKKQRAFLFLFDVISIGYS